MSSPPSMVRPSGSTANSRIDSARDTDRFASSTADWMTARSSVFCCQLGDRAESPRPWSAAHWLTASGSRVISAAMNGRASPTTTAWLIKGCARSRSSSGAGATFLPAAVTMISFLRPVIRQEAVVVERADVAGEEPSVVVEGRGGGGVVVPVPVEHLRALGEDLPVLRDADRGRRERVPDGSRLPRVGAVDGQASGSSRSGRSPRRS